MQSNLILDQIQAIQDELDKAHAAKSEANFAIDNSDSVDKSIIQALKNEGEDQKQTVENIQLIISKSNRDKKFELISHTNLVQKLVIFVDCRSFSRSG